MYLTNPYIFGGGAASLDVDDYTGIFMAFSLRKVSSSYSGNCIEIGNDQNSNTTNIGFTGGLGTWIDDSAISSFLTANSATTAHVVTWYDQSGNGYDISQSTSGAYPLLVSDVFGGTVGTSYSVQFDGSNDRLTRDMGSNLLFTGTNHTVYMAYNLDTSGFDTMWSCNSSSGSATTTFRYMRYSTAGRFYTNGSNNSFTGSANPKEEQAVAHYDGTTNTITLDDGTPDTLSTSGNAARRYFTFGAGADGTVQNWGGEIAEFLWFEADHGSSDQDTIRNDMNTIYTLY